MTLSPQVLAEAESALRTLGDIPQRFIYTLAFASDNPAQARLELAALRPAGAEPYEWGPDWIHRVG